MRLKQPFVILALGCRIVRKERLFKALAVVSRGISRQVAGALALERDAILELAQTEECHNLIRLFFLQERAKKQSYRPGDAAAAGKPMIARAAVIGAGVMGAGIAQWLSSRGLPVILRDLNAEQVAKGMAGSPGSTTMG